MSPCDADPRGAAPCTRRFPVLPVISIALVIGVAVLVIAFVLSRVEDEQHRGGPLRNAGRRRGAQPINTAFEGLTTFRGNATRSYYGEGPVPLDPVIGWRTPSARLCSTSFVGIESERVVRHGVDRAAERRGRRGRLDRGPRGRLRRQLPLPRRAHGPAAPAPADDRDLAKGSATTDPDGFPLYYAGSRDGRFRIVATDRRGSPSCSGRSTAPRASTRRSATTIGTAPPSSSTTSCSRAARTAGST